MASMALGKGFKLGNDVKQGDALSCSLFILAMEHVIRNISINPLISSIDSQRIGFTWPKVIAYADDITVISKISPGNIPTIFQEYE
jgi:hypothetical protein